MTTTPQLLTAEDLLRMPGDQRCELVNGELISMAPAGFDHGAVIMNLSVRLANHVTHNKLGIVVGAETGFLLKRNPDTVRGADIAFVSAARLPQGNRPTGYFPGAPDLAVEVVSPGDVLKDVDDKVDDYLQTGARAVWVVNPRRRTVTVHRPNLPPEMLREVDTLSGGDVVSDFSCSVSDVFA